MATKGKPEDRHWIYSNSSTKQCHKDQLCESKEFIIHYRIASVGYMETEMRQLIIW